MVPVNVVTAPVALCPRISVFPPSQGQHVELKRVGNDDLFSLVKVVVCGDDPRVKSGKPAPDIYLAAAAHLGVDPTR